MIKGIIIIINMIETIKSIVEENIHQLSVIIQDLVIELLDHVLDLNPLLIYQETPTNLMIESLKEEVLSQAIVARRIFLILSKCMQ